MKDVLKNIGLDGVKYRSGEWWQNRRLCEKVKEVEIDITYKLMDLYAGSNRFSQCDERHDRLDSIGMVVLGDWYHSKNLQLLRIKEQKEQLLIDLGGDRAINQKGEGFKLGEINFINYIVSYMHEVLLQDMHGITRKGKDWVNGKSEKERTDVVKNVIENIAWHYSNWGIIDKENEFVSNEVEIWGDKFYLNNLKLIKVGNNNKELLIIDFKNVNVNNIETEEIRFLGKFINYMSEVAREKKQKSFKRFPY